MATRVIPLETFHEVKDFDCGNEDAAAIFKKYGFIAFPDDRLTLCLPFASMPHDT